MPKRRSGADSEADGHDAATQAKLAELAHRLGESVRRLRARRGMSRKVLSQLSGVSERYLAQLETGQANVSFNVLWSLAQTMDTSVTSLLEERPDENPDLTLAKRLLESLSPEEQSAAYQLLRLRYGGQRAPSGRVALIGLRGAGKTTLGRLLARHYHVPFIRLTTLVEQTAGMDMPEIFIAMGQKGYRRLELNALQTAIAQHPRAVIETGGSIVSEPETFDLLLSSCFTVWLRASPQEHMQRVMEQGDTRPIEGHMQRAMDDLKAILDSRSTFYRRADAVLDTSGRGIEECMEELAALCAGCFAQPLPVAASGR
ncbi:helix-turn-helix transcriptional regulator [Azospirillum sp.]|uniref:helix-turn-helix transcriptional regulator n=1 Tax=Azospirillum sp. TaxID=34012 RepID=UPI002D4186D1|nr:helix-turn-helix transcriptional regulator [Azospirillum sp.]HYD69796.1 helix-turn-helix transcriptional regulator [Azospirillum sp.]